MNENFLKSNVLEFFSFFDKNYFNIECKNFLTPPPPQLFYIQTPVFVVSWSVLLDYYDFLLRGEYSNTIVFKYDFQK